MARPKIFHGTCVGIKLPKDVDTRVRAAALKSGKTISDIVRETLAQAWGKPKGQELHTK